MFLSDEMVKATKQHERQIKYDKNYFKANEISERTIKRVNGFLILFPQHFGPIWEDEEEFLLSP